MTAVVGIFSLRIVTVDFYMEKPKPGLDPCFSEFRSSEIKKVPIIRVFGSNTEGQKTCMHVHGIFPYLYIPYDRKDFETLDKAIYLIASSIDKAINISLGQGSSGSQHVFKIQLVKGIPFYGYHKKEHQYLKIYMLNPRFIRRVANLLQNGAIMGKIFHPHESHVPYILQFFIDYNLYGMSFLHVPNDVLKFRRNNDEEIIPYSVQSGQILNCTFAGKQSTSELEMDIGSAFILNRFQLVTKRSANSNPGIESIWEDERIRRQKLSLDREEIPPLEIPVSQGRPNAKPAESEEFYRIGLANKLLQMETSLDRTLNATPRSVIAPPETSAKEKKRTFNLKKLLANAVYPEEYTQDDITTNASFIEDHLSSRSIFHSSMKSSETPSIPESDEAFLDDTIVDEELVMGLTQPDFINQSLREQDMELLDVMKQLEEREEGNEVDLDSTLAPLSQNLEINTSQNLLENASSVPERSAIAQQDDDSDNECLNDFSIAMDELLLKLSQPSQPQNDIPTVEQIDGADDILRTPKKSKQRRKLPTTPRTPVSAKRTLKTDGGSPRTPNSVAKKYAALPLVIQSRSLQKVPKEKEPMTFDIIDDDTISMSSEEGDFRDRKLLTLRKKLALTELKRNMTDEINSVNANTPISNLKRKRAIDLDKTQITCNFRTRRKSERRLKVYETQNALECRSLGKSEDVGAITPVQESKIENLSHTSSNERTIRKKEKSSKEMENEISATVKRSPQVVLERCRQIKDSLLAETVVSKEDCERSSIKDKISKKKRRLSLRSHKKIKEEKARQTNRIREQNLESSEHYSGCNVCSDHAISSQDEERKLNKINLQEKLKECRLYQPRQLRIRMKRFKAKDMEKFISTKVDSKSPKTPMTVKKILPIVSNQKPMDALVVGVSHVERFKSSNFSTPRTPKCIEHHESDGEDDPAVHSFYEKSFFVDSPVFSEISVPSPAQVVENIKESQSQTTDKTVIITPHLLPETYEEVLENCRIYEIPDMVHQQPFYSNYADVTNKKEVGHTVLYIPGKSLNDIEDFQSTISNLNGFVAHRKELMQGLLGSFRNDDLIREYLSTSKVITITPCNLPPTRQDAKVWLKARDLLKEKNLKEHNKYMEEDSPIKIRRQKIVMLMDNESNESGEELDCSMSSISLTPLTPANACKINSKTPTPRTRDSYDRTPVTAVTSEIKTKRRHRSFRAKISLSQKLKDICISNALEKCSAEDVPATVNCIPTDKLLKTMISAEDETKSSQESSQSNETVTNEAVLAELEKSSFIKNLHGSQGSLDTSFGISIATLNNTYGFKVNLENLQQAKSDIEHNYLTTLSLEVFVLTREDLHPDPQFDPIMCIFYAIENSVPSSCTTRVSKLSGFIIISDESNPKLNGIDLDVEVRVVSNELEGLAKLVELCHYWDPDIFVGYEIEMSSWGYVMERAKCLDFHIAPLLSRVPSQKVRDFIDEDHDQLTDLDVETKLCGRILLDVWRLMRSEIALTSYTFENVMYHILHRRCPLHTYKDLTQWYQAQQTRWIVLEYYLERVKGTLQLLEQLDLIGRTSEMAKLIGIQFYEVLSRGSQFRVESMMLRIAKPKNLVPLSPSVQQRAHMRAPEYLPLILEPQSRFYPDPVIVLDFQSLYPSMIMAYNYCFSTSLGRVEHLGQSVPFEFGASQLRVSPTLLKKLMQNDLITISPCGVVFVKQEIREGILPRMLSEVLDTRQMVKQSMKLHKNSTALQRILHSRQLGLKLIANVTYGYTAANFSGRMPCVEVGDSVVAKGRETLERAIKLVEANEKWNVKVVYGDTDSLFVLVPGRSRTEAFRIGAEIAELVTQDNPQPVKLKLEKVYQPCILQTKKRYVGYMYESPDQEEPIYEAKGIETVRRDGCPAVAKMLEKCLRILFESADVSQVKSYVCRQFTKLLSGKANIQDLIFAKEFRGLNGYKPTACVPALELTRQWMVVDPRKIPRRGERVPFIVTNGPPGLPLIKLVRSPHDVLADEGLKINGIYYITKAIIPPLNRCLLLIGADVNEWFANLPRKVLFTPALSVGNEMIGTNTAKKSTISQYFSSTNCIIDCGRQTKQGICTFCSVDVTRCVITLAEKISKLQRGYHLTNMICEACCGRSNFVTCASLDCPVLYVLELKRRDQSQIAHLQSIINERY